jgi:hypothetical protein
VSSYVSSQGKNRILWLWLLKHYNLFLHLVTIVDGNQNDIEKAGNKSTPDESNMSTATEQVTVDSSQVTSASSIENDASTASQVTSSNSADRRPSLRDTNGESESAENNNDTSNVPPPVGLTEQTTRLMGNTRRQNAPRRPRPPQREPTLPGAVAVVGPDPPSVINDDYTLTPSTTTDVVSITDNSTVAVSAQLAPNQEHIQQEIRNRDLEIEELRRAREFVTVAQAVVEQEEEEDATGMQKLYRNSRIQCMALSALLLVIVVGIVLAIVFTRDASDVPEPTPTTPAPTPPSSLVEMLSTASLDGGEALLTLSTPQNEALNWLASNTNLDSYSDETRIQRYVLATLYYSTNGDSWTNNTGWLSDSDECGWYNGAAGGELCSSQGRVVELLDLSKNNLTGSIPAEVGLLSSSLGECASSNMIVSSVPLWASYFILCGYCTQLSLISFQIP